MVNIKKIVKNYEYAEDAFFDINEEDKIATVRLNYHSPKDIFENSISSKTPVISRDFAENIKRLYAYVPKHYSIDFVVEFDDLMGYTNDDLNDIFHKNVMLMLKTEINHSSYQTNLAFVLLGIGVLLVGLFLLIEGLWGGESIGRKVVTYIADILATISIWESMYILVVEKTEKRGYNTSLYKRFNSIKFIKKES